MRLGFVAPLLLLVGLVGCATVRDVAITSRPADAIISVDGVTRGKAPVSEEFRFGSDTEVHTVTASRPGFKEQSIKISRDYDRDSLLVVLRPRTRKVNFTVTPVPGVVSVDGKQISPDPLTQTSAELEFPIDDQNRSATHTVAAERPGFTKAELKVSWGDTTSDYTLPLGAMRKDLAIGTTPPGAQVYLNDQSLGMSPITYSGFPFPVNPDSNEWIPQKLRVVKPGYDPVEKMISWDDGKSDYHVDLLPHTKTAKLIISPAGATIKVDGNEVKSDASGVAAVKLEFPPINDKGDLKSYVVTASKKTADAEWEPLQFALKWDEGRAEYRVALKEIMIRPVSLLRPKSVFGTDGWQFVPELVTTQCNKDPSEGDGAAKPVKLTDLPKGTSIDTLAVSPDGSQVLFITLVSKGEKDLRSVMMAVKSDGSSGATTFGDDKSLDLTPSYTPDGGQIVFASNRGGRRMSIWEMSSSGDPGITRLTSGEENDLWPTVDSDPRPRLFFQALVDTRSDPRLYMTLLGANKITDLNRAGGMQPRVSPKGDAILFTAVNEKTGRRQIFRMPDRGGVPALLTASDANEFDPVWSPDGSRVAFVSNRGLDVDNRYNDDIWVMEVDHPDHVVRVTRNGSIDDCPAWDPSGQFIYFRSNRGGEWGIWKIAVK